MSGFLTSMCQCAQIEVLPKPNRWCAFETISICKILGRNVDDDYVTVAVVAAVIAIDASVDVALLLSHTIPRFETAVVQPDAQNTRACNINDAHIGT